MSYSNPVITGFHPDPSICRAGEEFYLVNSTFEYLPAVPVRVSRDLINWKETGHCLTRESQIDLEGSASSSGIYAPTIRYHQGRFYMVTTNMAHYDGKSAETFFVFTDDLEAGWSDPIPVKQKGIDPSLFFDDDGKVYMQSAVSFLFGMEAGIIQSEINIETGEIIGETRRLWNGTGERYPEGPHIYKKNGYYYLMIAEGGTSNNHMVTIARSRDIWGPYENCPENPILTNKTFDRARIEGIGHADLVDDPFGNWWLVCLGFRTYGNHFYHLGRETCLAAVVWGEDGWPKVAEGHIEETMEGHEWIDEVRKQEHPFMDDFEEEKLKTCWNFRKSFLRNQYSLTEKESCLAIYGQNVTLDQPDGSPSFIGHRQEAFACVMQTAFDAVLESTEDQAGVTLLYDEDHHFDLFLGKTEDRYRVCLRKKVDDIDVIVAEAAYPHAKVIFEIRANQKEYEFWFGEDTENMTRLGKALSKHLSTTMCYSKFVGVYVGMYVIGENAKGYFDYFSITNL